MEAALKFIRSESAETTMKIGETIGRKAAGGSVLAFRGDLGAGKTTMAKGIAAGLGVVDEVTSPSFTIISEYEGRLRLCHVDAWRLGGPDDFDEIGGFEMVSDERTLLLVEWSERLGDTLPEGSAIVEIKVLPDGSRSIRADGSWLEELLPDCSGSDESPTERIANKEKP
jgi:tRNA threonylcarbamoyladenosine biosynthesis protein TsaE